MRNSPRHEVDYADPVKVVDLMEALGLSKKYAARWIEEQGVEIGLMKLPNTTGFGRGANWHSVVSRSQVPMLFQKRIEQLRQGLVKSMGAEASTGIITVKLQLPEA